MILMLAILSLVVVLDQASKAAVAARLQEGAATVRTICGVRLRHIANRRHPWGSTRAARVLIIPWLLIFVAGCVIASMIEMSVTRGALGTVLGGATGNLIDGVRRRAVTDFIDLRVWPVFNVADAAIVVGALVLAWNGVRWL